MDIKWVIEKAKSLAERTGNHMDWALNELVMGLTIEQIGEIVESESQDERFTKRYARLINGQDVDGQIELGLRQRIQNIAHNRNLVK
jgi:hypothetical protein